MLHWHPASRNSAGDEASQARIAAKFRFRGKSAHAAGAPEQGRSAVDAVELTAHASELLREHTPDFTRIHHVITAGGNAPNVVPDFAEAFFYIRHPRSEVVRKLYPRLLKCAQAGALATETELETEYLGGIVEILPNETLGGVVRKNLPQLNDLSYDDAEKTFAAKIRETLDQPVSLESLSRVENPLGPGRQGIDRRRRRLLGRAHGRFQHRLLGARNPSPLVAGRGRRRNDHRPQGNDPRRTGPRCNGERFVRRPENARRRPRRTSAAAWRTDVYATPGGGAEAAAGLSGCAGAVRSVRLLNPFEHLLPPPPH